MSEPKCKVHQTQLNYTGLIWVCPTCFRDMKITVGAANHNGSNMTPQAPPWRCETCKFWDKSSRIFEHQDWGQCGREALEDCKYMNSSRKYEQVYTAPNFGCVQWEAKA